jgi:hypothetical protein
MHGSGHDPRNADPAATFTGVRMPRGMVVSIWLSEFSSGSYQAAGVAMAGLLLVSGGFAQNATLPPDPKSMILT